MDLEERTLESTRVFEGRVIHVRVDRVTLPNGQESTREIVDHRGAVAIVALNAKQEIVLVQQYRKALEKVTLEIPAGTLEVGEDPLDCARRELREEVRCKAASWEKIFDYYSAPGFCNERLSLYLARELSYEDGQPDEDEFLETVTIPLTEAYQYIFQGRIMDGKSIIGIQHAFHLLQGGND
ncbi:MAG TPA: NUDIX hydrolase [Syntrophomonadaceae bacterium]|nr:NUDIX hydrolase [Syntrophomonadaceae bacterium]